MKGFVKLIFIATALSILAGVPDVMGQKERVTRNTIDSLNRELRLARTPADSIAILLNLYDANSASISIPDSRDSNIKILNELYGAALRAGDTTAAYDAIRYLSTVARYDTPLIEDQLKRLKKLPESPEKRDTETFLRIQKYFWTLRDTTLSEQELRKRYSDIRKEVAHSQGAKTLNDRLEQQFALVLYGSNIIDADQMDKYLTDLGSMVEMTKDHREQLKSYYYRIAAMLYDENENPVMSNRADQIILRILDEHDELNKRENRKFKNYDYQRFTSYRRMLGNYIALSPDSIRIVYNELQKIKGRLPKHQLTDIDEATIDAMWAMYHKNYPVALKGLRKVISSRRFRNKPTYIKAYIKAASELGEIEDVKKGIELYSDLLISRARDAADTEYMRLKIEYQIDSLVTESKNAEREARAANRRTDRVAAVYFNYAIFGLSLLLVSILIVQFIANRRTRKIAEQLQSANQTLLSERNALTKAKADLEAANANVRMAMRQKSEFIHNVSHEISEPVKAIVGFTQLIVDGIPEQRRKYLNGFVDIINHNSTILQRLVGDILDTAEVDDAVTNVVVTHFDPDEAIHSVVDSMRPRLSDRQTFVIEPLRIVGAVPGGDTGVDTDASRLEQILKNVLDNAIKFGDKGKITVESELNFDNDTLTIAISDEGHGIPPGKEEIIFERFEKLGHYNEGLGLGLYVSRFLTGLLKGEIKVDTTYRYGTRMVLKVPIRLRVNNGNPVG